MHSKLKASLDYITSNKASGANGETLQAIIEKRVTSLVMLIAKVDQPTMDDTSKALDALGVAPYFDEEQKERIRRAINAKLEASEDHGLDEKAAAREQHNDYLEMYLDLGIVDILRSYTEQTENDIVKAAIRYSQDRLGIAYSKNPI